MAAPRGGEDACYASGVPQSGGLTQRRGAPPHAAPADAAGGDAHAASPQDAAEAEPFAGVWRERFSLDVPRPRARISRSGAPGGGGVVMSVSTGGAHPPPSRLPRAAPARPAPARRQMAHVAPRAARPAARACRARGHRMFFRMPSRTRSLAFARPHPSAAKAPTRRAARGVAAASAPRADAHTSVGSAAWAALGRLGPAHTHAAVIARASAGRRHGQQSLITPLS
jgi:hypothetical protein